MEKDTPDVCSPSRSVVSIISNFLLSIVVKLAAKVATVY
jgi:hypothetical protein